MQTRVRYGSGIALVAMAMALAACGSDDDDSSAAKPTIGGDLSAATFTYQCGGASDPQCNMDADLASAAMGSSFPALAVGSVFGLTAAPSAGVDAGGATYAVAPLSPDYLTLNATTHLFTAIQAGEATVFADKGTMPADLAALKLVVPTKLTIIQATPQGSFSSGGISIGPGGVSASVNEQFTFKFRAIAFSADDEQLAGALPCKWTSSDATVANITTDAASNIVTVVSGKAGTATLSVTFGPLSGNVAIKVGG